MMMQKALDVLYPPQCITCNATVETMNSGLCAQCWAETPFISGLICDCCGVPLPGEEPDNELGEGRLKCDECLNVQRSWQRGRAVALYGGNIRNMVLSLKHGDKADLGKPAGQWMADAAKDLITGKTLVAPVPLHWSRLLKRRYNQSALMASALSKTAEVALCQDLLIRRHRTPSMDGKTTVERAKIMSGNVFVHPRRKIRCAGRPVLLVDDVMTSGATLQACAEACKISGASRVDVVVLARVAKDA
nr:ComF family protein [Halocynthiibacter namhaensis]